MQLTASHCLVMPPEVDGLPRIRRLQLSEQCRPALPMI